MWTVPLEYLKDENDKKMGEGNGAYSIYIIDI